MTEHEKPTAILDGLLDNLEKAARERENASGDAIDRELAAPARTTAVRSLRDSPEVAAFRQALVDGLIRVDTVNRLLQLVNEVIVRLSV